MEPSPEKKPVGTIGSLNGGWSVMLRLLLATYPLVLLWSVWITSETFENRAFRRAGDRFTRLDAKALELKLERQVHEEVKKLEAVLDALPPDDWRDRILSLEASTDIIKTNQTRIIEKLDRLAPNP